MALGPKIWSWALATRPCSVPSSASATATATAAGDWDGNGTVTVGVFRPSTATWYVRNSNSAGLSIGGFKFGSPGDVPVAGDWDGSATTTIGVFR